MARTTTFQIPVDTSMFTPLQLQARSVFGLAMTGWARWLREHWVPFPRLIEEHGLGVVIAGLDLEYLRPFTFFDADAIDTAVTLAVRNRGDLLFLSLDVSPSDGSPPVARVSAVLRPVRISDGLVLSAAPTNLDLDALAGFEPDEVVTTTRPRLRTVVAELERGSSPVTTSSHTFTLHRHLCEAADQWSGIALSDITTEVRERLASGPGAGVDGLTAALVDPIRRIAIEFRRPAFFLDELTADCSAYERADGLVLLHRLSSAVDMEPLATFVEWFSPAEAPSDTTHPQLRQGVRT